MKRILLAILLACTGLALAQDGADDNKTLGDILQEREELSVFAELMETTGMMDEVTEPGVFTLFVPTDDAFDALGEDALAELMSREGVIEAVLRNHIALGGSPSDALARMNAFTNIAGYQYLVTMDDGDLFVNEARIVTPDLEGSNGVIHVIDTVLVPEPYWPLKNQSTIPAGGTSGGSD